MRYYHAPDRGLVAESGETQFALSETHARLASFRDLAAVASVYGVTIDEVTETVTADAVGIESGWEPTWSLPCRPDEVWAAGVTYEISEEAREAESGMPELYLDVYEAERPEVFFKATPNRIVDPGDAIGIRGDSSWDVPEPELAVVLYAGEIVGYTIGNDVSSRSIEGANPLYLPQAKIYDRCCAIGPAIASPTTVGDPHDLTIVMAIHRDGEVVFQGESSTSEMVRTCEEIVEGYRRHNAVPELGVLLTGTSLVPPDEFTLAEGDRVTIEIEEIGVLENPVITV